MNRLHQVLLIATFLPLCWLAMMLVHELGHVLGALATGGVVSKVVLHPFAISRTDLSQNPHPLFVVWSGPIVGAVLPLTLLALVKVARCPWPYLARFFAGFCLIANGAYLSVGSFDGIGDTGVAIRHGTPMWYLWVFGLITFPLGLLLWHGLGPSFGLGKEAQKIDRGAAHVSCTLLVLMLGLTL